MSARLPPPPRDARRNLPKFPRGKILHNREVTPVKALDKEVVHSPSASTSRGNNQQRQHSHQQQQQQRSHSRTRGHEGEHNEDQLMMVDARE
mmetsp:Transcript_17092/g.27652  ORF Transcript_17092/g.27652 Transcript_17092/m.27652 type:complete len:92 (-) Transcript_17092:4-279(-)